MEPQTVTAITQWLTLFFLITAIVGSIGIIGTAVYQTLKARQVRWDALIFAFAILWAMPYGIRNYGPELVDAGIDLINSLAAKREPLRAAIENLIGDTGQGLGQPTSTPQTVEEPPVLITTPTPDIFQETATAFFATNITATPTETPRPMIEPTSTTQPPQAPTVFICRSAHDVMAGCQPPTPAPGG